MHYVLRPVEAAGWWRRPNPVAAPPGCPSSGAERAFMAMGRRQRGGPSGPLKLRSSPPGVPRCRPSGDPLRLASVTLLRDRSPGRPSTACARANLHVELFHGRRWPRIDGRPTKLPWRLKLAMTAPRT
eukprot:scaffold1418_cov352-Prasinococcus_capsulatus_cf.AAC.1